MVVFVVVVVVVMVGGVVWNDVELQRLIDGGYVGYGSSSSEVKQ